MSNQGDKSTSGPRIRALRGATTIERDEAELVVAATEEVLEHMLDRNGVDPSSLISIVFTATPDITSEFPAVAARRLGLSDVPLLCAAEMAVPGALPLCIRVLLHAQLDTPAGELRHVYLRGARGLRSDLERE